MDVPGSTVADLRRKYYSLRGTALFVQVGAWRKGWGGSKQAATAAAAAARHASMDNFILGMLPWTL